MHVHVGGAARRGRGIDKRVHDEIDVSESLSKVEKMILEHDALGRRS